MEFHCTGAATAPAIVCSAACGAALTRAATIKQTAAIDAKISTAQVALLIEQFLRLTADLLLSAWNYALLSQVAKPSGPLIRNDVLRNRAAFTRFYLFLEGV